MFKSKQKMILLIGLPVLSACIVLFLLLWRTGSTVDVPDGSTGSPGPLAVIEPTEPVEPDTAPPAPPAESVELIDPVTIPPTEPESEPDTKETNMTDSTEPHTEPVTTLPEDELIHEANDLTESLIVTLSTGRSSASLLDRDYNTRLNLRDGVSINIIAPEAIHSLYVIWGLPPGEWTVSGASNVSDDSNASGEDSETGVQISEPIIQTFGADGFIHEYVTLDHPAGELTISLPQGGATICDIYAFSGGSPPDWVQVWDLPHDKADILILPTHADDEHLFFVGILPYYGGEMGYNVQVAYLTNHWREPPRPHELLNGLWTVGIRNYPVISEFRDIYADTLIAARSRYNFDRMVDYQVELLRRFKPSVVVGHDLNGEYGHGVHMLGAHALLTAADKSADSGYHIDSYEKYGVWDIPKLYLHLHRENAVNLDWNIPRVNFGGATAYEMAVAGYDCHISQHRWDFSVPRTGPRGHRFGLVRSLVGEDIVGACLMENIIYGRHGMGHIILPQKNST